MAKRSESKALLEEVKRQIEKEEALKQTPKQPVSARAKKNHKPPQFKPQFE